MAKEYPYLFSIITAVYQAEPYLEETISSVLSQDIGFEKNVQLILVDDGSLDRSGEICDDYAKRYPDNIKIVHQENKGVSAARNAGLELASGRYLNFLDSDDKLSADALRHVYDFFVCHEDETDVVAIPMKHFGRISGSYWENYRFDQGTRVIDLREEPIHSMSSVSSAFFKQEEKYRIHFDPRLSNGEDIKVFLLYLYPKMTLGAVHQGTYFYRRKPESGSLSQTGYLKKSWYFEWFSCLVDEICQFYQEKLGFVPGFVQCTLLGEYQWRILTKNSPAKALSQPEIQQYKEILFSSLAWFEDSYILAQQVLLPSHKLLLLCKKYNASPVETYPDQDRCLTIQGHSLWRDRDQIIYIDFLTIRAGTLEIDGYARILCLEPTDTVSVTISCNNDTIPCQPVARDANLYCLGDELVAHGIPFRASIPLDGMDQKGGLNQIEFFVEINGHRICRKNIHFGRFCPLNQRLEHTCWATQDIIFTYQDGTIFWRFSQGWRDRWRCERKLCKEIAAKGDQAGKEAAHTRRLVFWYQMLIRRKIFLISDREDRGGDNGEAFFRYLLREKPSGIRPIYVISKDSSDYRRLKKEGGSVIPFGGKRDRLYALLGEKTVILSSHDDRRKSKFYYAGLRHQAPFVFLQHGVTKDDVSGWLNRYQQNFSLFLTSTQPEYQSIREGAYHYDDPTIQLTGMPRFDQLYRDEKNIVTIMPTWRSYLKSERELARSDYYCFFQKLFCHPELHRAAKQLGYQLWFCPHPNAGLAGINTDPSVHRWKHSIPYRDIFAQSNLLVTDYSSTAFDFAYLGKPVVYCQFDKERFFSGKHTYTAGYFDYEKDGFGEVEYDLESTVSRIIEYMETDCRLKPIYQKRIEKTFAFQDQNNCKRVLESVEEMMKR